MLDTLRRGAGNWLAKGLLGLLVIAFAAWGVADVFRGYGAGSIAKVGSTEIGIEQFQTAYQNEMNQISSQIGRRLTPDQARMFQVENRVLSRLVGTAALDTQAKSLGLGLAEKAVVDAIRTDPTFFGIDGKFSKPAFDQATRQIGLSEAGYIALRRREDVREQLTDGVVSGVVVPGLLVEQVHRYNDETRVIEHAKIDVDKTIKVAEPNDAQLQAYYDQNKRLFMTPAYRKVALLTLTRDLVKPKIAVSDDDAKAAYEAEKDKFNTPEKRRILQVSFPDKAAADKAYEALSKAANFVEAAGKLGFKESDIDLGVLTQKDMIDKKIAEAAFRLKKDEVSKPVEGQFTTVILRIADITPGVTRTFENVKAEVVDRIANERAVRELQTLHDKVDDERNAGRTFKETAAKLGVTFKEFEAVDRSGKLPDGKVAIEGPDAAKIFSAVFGGTQGVEADAVELSDGGYAWFDILGTTPEKEKPFDTVKADVKAAWIDSERNKMIADFAAKLVERLIKGEAFEAVAKTAGGTAEKTAAVNRKTSPQGLTADAMRQAFALPKGSASSSTTADGKSRTVFRVTDVIAAPAMTKEQADALTAELKRTIQLDTINSYVQGLQARYGVSINNVAVRQALGLGTGQ